MEQEKVLYHGSERIVERPVFGQGKPYNDYGRGFYCTESKELAKEWACQKEADGFASRYRLPMEGLSVLRLTERPFHILNWLAMLLVHRHFDISSPISAETREYLITNFLPDTTGVDVMVGYRADDSYFSFASDFVNNTLSLRDLNYAMRLGTLGEQVVLLSQKAFDSIEFLGYEVADYREYYYKRKERAEAARAAYKEKRRSKDQLLSDIFALDIMRGGMKNDDPRLQSVLFG